MWELSSKNVYGIYGKLTAFSGWRLGTRRLYVDRYYNGSRVVYYRFGTNEFGASNRIDAEGDLSAMIDHMFDEEDWTAINPIVDWLIDHNPEFARFALGEQS